MGIAGYSAEHRAVSGEEVHETSSGNMQGIVHGRVLQGVGHYDHGSVVDVDGFNAERRISGGTGTYGDGWQGRVIERPRAEYLRLLEAGVVNPTLPDLKLVARRKLPVVFLISARPLYTAPVAADGIMELSTTKVTELPPVQAESVPSSVSKMKSADAPFTLKVAPLGGAKIPVGDAALELPFGGGIVKKPLGAPLWSYNVVNPLLLSEIQKGLPGIKAIPQGFTSLESGWAAIVAVVSDTRLVCL